MSEPKSQTALPKDGLCRLKDFAHLIPFSRTTLWRMVNAGKFPKPTRLSTHCSVWRTNDILNWIENQGEM